MAIAELLNKHYLMNDQQREIVAHQQGPLHIIAGPGSGKTRSLLLLVMNLILCGNAHPSQIILCTYTEKVAHEMQERLLKIAAAINYTGDLSPIKIGTIHSICKTLLSQNAHYTHIESDFTILDQFTQQLLIFESFNHICNPAAKRFFLARWGSPWQVAKELRTSFDKIVEELLFEKLLATYKNRPPTTFQKEDEWLCYHLLHAYNSYQKLLQHRNHLDFAHIQKCVYNLLKDNQRVSYLTKDLRYIFVDEYQDTSYIQEQILRLLAEATPTRNLCVVGDEDQALYRFRGATVRNILEFQQLFPSSKKVSLFTNYRCHQQIINTCNTWMNCANWSNPHGTPFRTEKEIKPGPNGWKEYNSVYTATYPSPLEEAEQFAELVLALKAQGKIEDYSQVALLLRSVKPELSAPYINALQKRNIPFFCPRARSYFTQDEVRLMIGCLARILHYQPSYTDDLDDRYLCDNLNTYLDECKKQFKTASSQSPYLLRMILDIEQEIALTLENPELPGKKLSEYFYRLITVAPFLSTLKKGSLDPEALYHLETFCQLLDTFQTYYQHPGLTCANRATIARDFFQRFLALLHIDGLNQHEDAYQPLPPGHVPILTIHQAKGLEFPVVVVGRLDKLTSFSDSQKHKALQALSEHAFLEPERLIPAFDQHRLYYVAFSRAKHLLILTASKQPNSALTSLWRTLPTWSPSAIPQLPTPEALTPSVKPIASYGFTSHIQLYNTCPRQYHFFRAHRFIHSSPGDYISGQLVHATLEHIHRLARDGALSTLNEATIARIFERKLQVLQRSLRTTIDSEQKASAWQQVFHYVQQNQEELRNVFAAELQVQLADPSHMVTGKIDLLLKNANSLILIDFKTLSRAQDNAELLKKYEQQLYFYAHALERSKNQRPHRLFLYWTAEQHKEHALMEIAYDPEKVANTKHLIQETVMNIETRKFHVWKPPAPEVCQRCDLRHLCRQDRVI